MTAFDEIRIQAVARVLARKRPPITTTVRCQGQAVRYSRVEGSEYLPAQNIGEWVDDRLVSQPWSGPFCATLYVVAEAARVSQAAAAAEVSSAKRLSQHNQHHCYVTLQRWRDKADIPSARALMAAVLAEWERAGLVDERPLYSELPERPDPAQPAKLRYPTRWGFPAGKAMAR